MHATDIQTHAITWFGLSKNPICALNLCSFHPKTHSTLGLNTVVNTISSFNFTMYKKTEVKVILILVAVSGWVISTSSSLTNKRWAIKRVNQVSRHGRDTKPGSVLTLPIVANVLSNNRRPLFRVFKNCCSS